MKRKMAWLICMVMCLTSVWTWTAAANEAADGSDWATEAVQKAEWLGIFNREETADLTEGITREAFCDMVYRYMADVPNLPTAVYEKDVFSDTENAHVIALHALKIVNGKSETVFAPDALLTREEAAVILERMTALAYPDWVAHELYFEFSDHDEISDWAMNGIQRICNMEIMRGTGDGRFAPLQTYTVEQAAVTLMRIYEHEHDAAAIGIIGGGDGETEINVSDLDFSDRINALMSNDQNYMFSPLSIKMALSLAANGASGVTEDELLSAMGIENLDDFNTFSKDLIERYSQTDLLRLQIADSIWINQDQTEQTFSDGYQKTAKDFYHADVKTVSRQKAVAEINQWVSDRTDGKIAQIVQDDDFWAMLVNAIYFKGAWLNEFREAATQKGTFVSADGGKSSIDFMHRTDWIRYAETESARMLVLPYLNRQDHFTEDGEYIDTESYDDLDVSMYLLLPKEEINVSEVLEKAIEDQAFSGTYIHLAMPKFQFAYSTSLSDILQKIGIQAAFDPQTADFKRMFDSGNMWFTDAIHKTYISVDEKGTEAAAVTAIGMAGSSLPPQPMEVTLDHPFYFVIRDNHCGEILFMGRFADGSEKQGCGAGFRQKIKKAEREERNIFHAYLTDEKNLAIIER